MLVEGACVRRFGTLLVGVALCAGCGKEQARSTGAVAPDASPGPAVAAAAVKDTPPTPAPALLRDGMARLRPEDPAAAVNGVTVTWGEVQRAVNWPRDDAAATDNDAENARTLVGKWLQRSLLLAEARRRGLSVSEEEKAAHLARLDQALRASGKTLDGYLRQFPEKPTSPLQISLADSLLVVKLGSALLQDIEVTADEQTQAAAQMEAMRAAMMQQNDRTRQQLEALAAMPEASTDEGFAALAREHSHGREAPDGGVVGSFTRAVIAKANGGQPFTLAPGATSGVIETETSFRIIRVLELVPPDGENAEERVKIAQVLMRKQPVPAPPSQDELAESVKQQKVQAVLTTRTAELARGATFSCPLFPDLCAELRGGTSGAERTPRPQRGG